MEGWQAFYYYFTIAALCTYSFQNSVLLSCTTQQSLSQTEAQAITYKPGDILVTNSTSAKGIAEYSAIAINSKKVIHTSGWSSPKSELYPKVMTIKDWESRYKNKVKVVRPNSSTLGKNAVKYFKNKRIP